MNCDKTFPKVCMKKHFNMQSGPPIPLHPQQFTIPVLSAVCFDCSVYFGKLIGNITNINIMNLIIG